jgi:hypothetical protein
MLIVVTVSEYRNVVKKEPKISKYEDLTTENSASGM